MSFIIKSEPLFLPSGSVRALLVLIVNVLVAYLVLQNYNVSLFTDLITGQVTVVGIYFAPDIYFDSCLYWLYIRPIGFGYYSLNLPNNFR